MAYRLTRMKHRNKTQRRRPTDYQIRAYPKKKAARRLYFGGSSGPAAFNIWSQWNATRSGRARLMFARRRGRFTPVDSRRFYGY